MSVQQPFQPQANTVLISVSTSTSAAPTQPSTGSIQGMLATWTGATPCYVSISASSSVGASVPTTGTPSLGMPILPNTQPSLTVPPNCWVSAVTTAGTGSLFLTPGSGF